MRFRSAQSFRDRAARQGAGDRRRAGADGHRLRRRAARSILSTVALGLLLPGILSGCASSSSSGSRWDGPQVAQPVSFEPWTFHDVAGRTVKTAHYAIHTTIEDRDLLTRLAQVMEGGMQQYERFTPGLPVSNRPMECYVFARRPEWAQFTREYTGQDAVIYLKINRGGYTVRDWFVSYLLSDESTFAVAAHEGWHQFVARNFKNRLPPFLEEGIATQFENIHWSGDLPRWNLSINAGRAQRLRQASEGKYLWPLEKLVTMHAGDVVGLSGERIEAFYAQNWAFVRFLWDGDGGKYRQGFQKMLTDTANGIAWDAPPGQPARAGSHPGFPTWNPATVKPMLEHYLGADLPTIDTRFRAYIHEIAFDRFNEQWKPMS